MITAEGNEVASDSKVSGDSRAARSALETDVEPTTGSHSPQHVGVRTIAIAALGLAALWAFDLFVLQTTQLVGGRIGMPLTPLYAFWSPLFRPQGFAFVFLAASTVFASARLVDVRRVKTAAFVGALFVLALSLPLMLFLVREPLVELGAQPVVYRYQDFLRDAPRAADLGLFLRDYVAQMDTLSLRAQHYPPGTAVLFHAVGASEAQPLPAGILVLASSALAVLVAFACLRQIASERAARQGALVCLACPSIADFACTTADSIVLLGAMIAWWCALRAFSRRRTLDAALLGVALFVTMCVSFVALPIGLAFAIYGGFELRRERTRLVITLATASITFVACAIALQLATGFSMDACFVKGHANAVEFLAKLAVGKARSGWFFRSYGNLSAFAIGSGVALVAAAMARQRSRSKTFDAWSTATLVSITIFSFGGLFAMETERIWLFAMPWLAAFAVSAGEFDSASTKRLLAAGFVQTFAMEVLLFTHW